MGLPQTGLESAKFVADLAFDDVHKSYGSFQALKGVTLEVRPGEVFGLLGPNGAGKTTLIRIALDIIRADRGAVMLFGRPLDRSDLDRVSYLPEERGLYKRQRVIEVMTYFGELKGMNRGDAKERAMAWLDKVGLAAHARDRVDRLSKGMSQKVQIASALMTEPELCVLDEPFSGLDPVNVQLVKDLMVERRASGRSTILSTHLMNQVEALCDRVAMIDRGELVVYGDTEEVRRVHSHPEARVRLSAGTLPEVRGAVRAALTPDGSWLVRLEEGFAPDVYLAALIEAGARVVHFEQVLAPIEQVFLDVVGRAAA
jgi:ABC-2 type transport system ATP-binding protein